MMFLPESKPAKKYPKLEGKQVTVNVAAKSYRGEVVLVNPTYIMLLNEDLDSKTLVPWEKIENVIILPGQPEEDEDPS